VDDFGVQYVGKEHAQHLINALEKDYKVSKDWSGGLYCGITMKWDAWVYKGCPSQISTSHAKVPPVCAT
jgi:hypothetical protein